MPLDKFAPWGTLPAPAATPPSSATLIVGALDRLTTAQAPLQALNFAGSVLTIAKSLLEDAVADVTESIDAANPNTQLQFVATAIDNIGPRPGTTRPTVPSQSAFLIVWALNGVRDALCDQHSASPASTNKQLNAHRNNRPAKFFNNWLTVHPQYAYLAPGFGAQFRELSSSDKTAFEIERRARLLELANFELEVMTTLMDNDNVPLAVPVAGRVRGARKS